MDTQFANAKQPIFVNNMQNIQSWIVSLYENTVLYTKESGSFAYYKIDLAILWFANTIG